MWTFFIKPLNMTHRQTFKLIKVCSHEKVIFIIIDSYLFWYQINFTNSYLAFHCSDLLWSALICSDLLWSALFECFLFYFLTLLLHLLLLLPIRMLLLIVSRRPFSILIWFSSNSFSHPLFFSHIKITFTDCTSQLLLLLMLFLVMLIVKYFIDLVANWFNLATKKI